MLSSFNLRNVGFVVWPYLAGNEKTPLCFKKICIKHRGGMFQVIPGKYSVVREGRESSIGPPSGEKKPAKARNFNRQLHHPAAGASRSSAVTS